MKSLKSFSLQALFTLIFLEFFSFILLQKEVIRDIYTTNGITSNYYINSGMKWRTEDQDWGAWHKKNYRDKHQKTCFKVIYESNNVGARDNIDYPNSFSKKDSIIFLGDSLVEGFGLNNNMTMPKRLQEMRKKFVYNLGSSYDLGPLQYLMIYKHFKDLPHETVIVGFSPANDFKDNDFNQSSNKPTRFRPYYKTNEKNSNYPIHYTNSSLRRKNVGRTKIQNFAGRISMKSNLIRLLRSVIIINNNKLKVDKKSFKTFYNSATIDQQVAAISHIKKIYYEAKKNNVKRFIVLGMPLEKDFNNYIENGKKRDTPLWEKMFFDFSKKNKDFKYIDGFSALNKLSKSKDFKNMFFSCDNHWNENGAFINAELISNSLDDF